MSNDTKNLSTSADSLHTCSYACERPGCIRAQRDYLAAENEALREELAALKAESASNYPIKYYKRGGVTYAVHGTSSINFVERLLAEIADTTAAEADKVRGSLEAQPDGTIHFEEYPQPAEGEEIMVNTPYDVFTLPLQPSGLSSGPRFVVHVPGPEQQPAAVDGASVDALREEIERLLDEIERLLDSREREGDRLDWLLARLPGDVIRDLVGEMSCTSDVAEWRHRIDKAARFNPRPGEFGG